jgi:ABC-type transport system involved in cytochrome c biogenesis ATPase subunit
LEVAGLFSDRGYRFTLDPSATILTGENGSGKSTILRALHFMATGNWQAFSELPVQRVRLVFEDGAEFAVSSEPNAISVSSTGEPTWTHDPLPADRASARYRAEYDHIRRRLQRATTRNERDALARHAQVLRQRIRSTHDADFEPAPDWIESYIGRFKTKLISARRLEHQLRPDAAIEGEDTPIPVVEQFAQQLSGRMRDELSMYAAESRRHEKVLPSQIVQAMQAEGPHDAEILAQDVDRLRSEVRELAGSLARVGLFQEEDPDSQFTEYPRNNHSILLAVREVYRVTKLRLERLTGLRSDLDFFARFLNSRLSNKQIDLNQETGIGVTLDSDEQIRPSELSSGEQQLLALAYELLFGTESQSVVLLDEPELSLHVAWLQGLLSAFIEMGQSRTLQFIIATHSPSVLAGNTDHERSLDA